MTAVKAFVGYFIALLWPWSVLQTYLGVSPVGILVGLLALAGLGDAIYRRQLRAPWELVWPTLLVALLALRGDVPLVWPVAFLGFAHLFHHERGTIAQCAVLSSLSAGVAGMLSVAREYLGGFPSAFSVVNGATLYFPASLSEGGLILAFCCALGLAAVGSPALHGVLRIFGVLGAGLCAVVLCRLLLATAASWAMPTFPCTLNPFPLDFLAALALIWLCARMASKALVARWTDSPAGQQFFALPPLVLLVYLLLLPAALPVALVAMLGLCAAYLLPPAEGKAPALALRYALPLMAVAGAGVAAIVSQNLDTVDPRNTADSRHYVARASALFEKGRDEEALIYLDRVDALSPSERQTHGLRATWYLERGALDQAVSAFSRSLDGPTPRVLPPPGDGFVEQFMQGLRDRASAQAPGARGLAYVRALVRTGQEENGWELLKSRPVSTPPESLDGETLAAVVAWLAGAPQWAARLGALDRAQTFGMLVDAGAVARAPAPDAPEGAVVLIVPGVSGGWESRIVFTAAGTSGKSYRKAPFGAHDGNIQIYYIAADRAAQEAGMETR